MKNIEVCERAMDWRYVPVFDDEGDFTGTRQVPKYHAQIEGQPGVWEAGDTPAEAIGDLVEHHPEVFGVKVSFLGRLPR